MAKTKRRKVTGKKLAQRDVVAKIARREGVSQALVKRIITAYSKLARPPAGKTAVRRKTVVRRKHATISDEDWAFRHEAYAGRSADTASFRNAQLDEDLAGDPNPPDPYESNEE